MDRRVVAEGSFESNLYPVSDSITQVPPSVQHRDQPGVSDRARPIDPLTLQVAAVVEHTGISINPGPAQLHQNLQSIARSQIERLEKTPLFRIVEKFAEPGPPAVGLPV